MPRVGLHMIVRDEAHVIERCLRSVRPLIDWWVVSDTGSSDGTQELVRRTLADVPGRLLERPWVNFGHNRQEALEAARALPQSSAEDHVLWIDADEELVDLPTGWPDLDADGHHLEVEFGPLRYQRLALVRLGMPWRWRGAVHEYLDLPDAEIGALGAPRVLVRKEGARSKDPDTYRKDALLIEAELVREPDDPRMQFYLGQSWRDAGEPERALAAYRKRAANPAGWLQERGLAALEVGLLLEQRSAPAPEVSDAFLDAVAWLPGRAEPLVHLARVERLRGRHEVAHVFASAAMAITAPPPDALFADLATYAWRARDEHALACWWTGRYAEGLPSALAASRARPDDPRLQENVAWFRRRLGSERRIHSSTERFDVRVEIDARLGEVRDVAGNEPGAVELAEEGAQGTAADHPELAVDHLEGLPLPCQGACDDDVPQRYVLDLESGVARLLDAGAEESGDRLTPLHVGHTGHAEHRVLGVERDDCVDVAVVVGAFPRQTDGRDSRHLGGGRWAHGSLRSVLGSATLVRSDVMQTSLPVIGSDSSGRRPSSRGACLPTSAQGPSRLGLARHPSH
nr:hypothetical protein [Nocardioides alcanivorans]